MVAIGERSGLYAPMADYQIERDDLSAGDVLALLQLHLDEMHQWSPPQRVHAMPAERLREDDVTFYSARCGGKLAAIGAIKDLGGGRGELKSMRASPQFRGKGAGEAMLVHLLQEARRRNYHWLGLETGRPAPFLPAIGLYRKYGFVECPAFADYVSNEFSICMSRQI